MQHKPWLIIVSPALAAANNGNWQTAWRWSRLLSPHYRCRIVQAWTAAEAGAKDEPAQAMLALHARRSAASIQAWSQAYPGAGLVVVLTGTDFYRDIQNNREAQASLQLAQRLVVLQELGPDALPIALRSKCRVIFQSTTARQSLEKSASHLRAMMVGHLREEKSPQTLFQAAYLLQQRNDILIDHLGAELDPVLGELAQQTALACPHYRWLGERGHEATRRHIQRAHVLVHCSQMEGGAHVLMEAMRCGTPVLASRIAGNIGMLGQDYAGFFEWGDAQALAKLLQRCRDEPELLAQLRSQCSQRAPLFAPARERAALIELIDELRVSLRGRPSAPSSTEKEP